MKPDKERVQDVQDIVAMIEPFIDGADRDVVMAALADVAARTIAKEQTEAQLGIIYLHRDLIDQLVKFHNVENKVRDMKEAVDG